MFNLVVGSVIVFGDCVSLFVSEFVSLGSVVSPAGQCPLIAPRTTPMTQTLTQTKIHNHQTQ
jgi:hypothetical protein